MAGLAGGDVHGTINAGLNVVAIEKDPEQYLSTIAYMHSAQANLSQD